MKQRFTQEEIDFLDDSDDTDDDIIMNGQFDSKGKKQGMMPNKDHNKQSQPRIKTHICYEHALIVTYFIRQMGLPLNTSIPNDLIQLCVDYYHDHELFFTSCSNILIDNKLNQVTKTSDKQPSTAYCNPIMKHGHHLWILKVSEMCHYSKFPISIGIISVSDGDESCNLNVSQNYNFANNDNSQKQYYYAWKSTGAICMWPERHKQMKRFFPYDEYHSVASQIDDYRHDIVANSYINRNDFQVECPRKFGKSNGKSNFLKIYVNLNTSPKDSSLVLFGNVYFGYMAGHQCIYRGSDGYDHYQGYRLAIRLTAPNDWVKILSYSKLDDISGDNQFKNNSLKNNIQMEDGSIQ